MHATNMRAGFVEWQWQIALVCGEGTELNKILKNDGRLSAF